MRNHLPSRKLSGSAEYYKHILNRENGRDFSWQSLISFTNAWPPLPALCLSTHTQKSLNYKLSCVTLLCSHATEKIHYFSEALLSSFCIIGLYSIRISLHQSPYMMKKVQSSGLTQEVSATFSHKTESTCTCSAAQALSLSIPKPSSQAYYMLGWKSSGFCEKILKEINLVLNPEKDSLTINHFSSEPRISRKFPG